MRTWSGCSSAMVCRNWIMNFCSLLSIGELLQFSFDAAGGFSAFAAQAVSGVPNGGIGIAAEFGPVFHSQATEGQGAPDGASRTGILTGCPISDCVWL